MRSWKAALKLEFKAAGEKSFLSLKESQGPLTVQALFYPEKTSGVLPCHCYLLHPPGGVAAGDCLDFDISAVSGARVLITTPSAQKFYVCKDGRAVQRTVLRVEGSELCCLPQETLFFNGTQAVSSIEAELDEKSTFLGTEIFCFGRFNLGEDFSLGTLDACTSLRRGRHLLFTERLRLDKDFFILPQGPAALPCLLTLYAVPKLAEAERLEGLCQSLKSLECCRSDLLCAVTARAGVLILRAQGTSLIAVKKLQLAALNLIYPKLLRRDFVPPRIWHT